LEGARQADVETLRRRSKGIGVDVVVHCQRMEALDLPRRY
jgi:hypothetical protein